MTFTDVLKVAHQVLRKAVPKLRREAANDEGPLAASFRAAMVNWDAQKADGVPIEERQKGLEHTLRAAWPQTREWKYLCQQCNDYGLVMSTCPGDATCGRTKAHLPHDFGTPCWCSNGAKFRDKPKPSRDDFQAAGKSKPTKLGR